MTETPIRSLRVAILSPFASSAVRGNSITVNRIADGLRQRGVQICVWDCSTTPVSQLSAEVEAFRPSLIHSFHAYRVGPLALKIASGLAIPMLVTVTGTDGNHDLFDAERGHHVRKVLEDAAGIAVFHISMRDKIFEELPQVGAKIAVVPQSVALQEGLPYPLAEQVDLPIDPIIILFPAGIRKVKNPLFPLEPLDRLLAQCPEMRLLYAGPILEDAEGQRLLDALALRAWASYLGEVPHRQMRSLLESADIVLNCSISEGGMANSLLEAMACARPVLASDIEGNRSLVEDGATGFLFRDGEELTDKAARLIESPGLRQRMGLAARSRFQTQLGLDREIDGYLGEYRRLLGS